MGDGTKKLALGRHISLCELCSSQGLLDRIRQYVAKYIRTSQFPDFCNTSACFCKFSTPDIFSEFAIGQYILDNLIYAKYYYSVY